MLTTPRPLPPPPRMFVLSQTSVDRVGKIFYLVSCVPYHRTSRALLSVYRVQPTLRVVRLAVQAAMLLPRA